MVSDDDDDNGDDDEVHDDDDHDVDEADFVGVTMEWMLNNMIMILIMISMVMMLLLLPLMDGDDAPRSQIYSYLERDRLV